MVKCLDCSADMFRIDGNVCVTLVLVFMSIIEKCCKYL